MTPTTQTLTDSLANITNNPDFLQTLKSWMYIHYGTRALNGFGSAVLFFLLCLTFFVFVALIVSPWWFQHTALILRNGLCFVFSVLQKTCTLLFKCLKPCFVFLKKRLQKTPKLTSTQQLLGNIFKSDSFTLHRGLHQRSSSSELFAEFSGITENPQRSINIFTACLVDLLSRNPHQEEWHDVFIKIVQSKQQVYAEIFFALLEFTYGKDYARKQFQQLKTICPDSWMQVLRDFDVN
jgi:hypothetical protein